MKTFLALTTILIFLIIITSDLAGCLVLSNSGMTTDAIISQTPAVISLAANLADVNETTNELITSVNYGNISTTLTISSILDEPKLAMNRQPNNRPFYPPSEITNYSQISKLFTSEVSDAIDPNESGNLGMTGSNNIMSSAPVSSVSTSLDNTNFYTYTYGAYSVQQTSPNQFFFTFPDYTSQGQLTGSDAFSLNTYSIQRMDFEALFITPKISAAGFDEMAVFAASNTSTYKGTEFGIRLGLSDGYIYGYIQEPKGNNRDVDFQMLKLSPNDETFHHYSLIMLGGTEVAFAIDGTEYGRLSFPSETDYSNLTYTILAVVHRFTNNWDSTGDNMTIKNFTLS